MSFEEGVFTMEDGRLSVRFRMVYKDLPFQDAIVLTEEEYNALSPEQIAEMKTTRFNNWIAALEAGNSEEPISAPE
jgi:hypothetical protein